MFETANTKNMKLPFLLILVSLILSGCRKEESKCEKWEVEYYCIPLTFTAFCSATRVLTIYICNESDLADAHAGRETVTFESTDQKEMRKYIRRVD
jgi:hypothetical protein